MAFERALGERGTAAATGPADGADPKAAARTWRCLVVAQIALLMAVVVALAARRSFLNFGTETDFLLAFMREAVRLIQGEALVVGFHPPLYPTLLAASHALTGDWLAAGITISLLAALATAAVAWRLFDGVFGPAAAAGALMMLLASPVFLQFAAQATTDVLYLALFLMAGWLAVSGTGRPARWRWRALGLVLGCALLTRTNALTLLLLLSAPLLAAGSWRARWRALAAVAAGLALPFLAYAVHALSTGSPLLPRSNHLNLAMTYFASAGDCWSLDAMHEVRGRFSSMSDVLTHDPAHFAARFLSDLAALATGRLSTLAVAPAGWLVVPGLACFALACRTAGTRLLLGAIVAQALLVNMKCFEVRYWLFLLPFAGAGLGIAASWLPNRFRLGRRPAAAAALLVTAAAALLATGPARSSLMSDEIELASAVPVLRRLVGPADVALARKPHAGFYAGATWRIVPEADSATAFRTWFCGRPAEGDAWLYIGTVERTRRPALTALAEGPDPPPWLSVAARDPAGLWSLHRLTPCTPSERRAVSAATGGS